MLINLIKYLRGYVKIQITGYFPERFINLCSHHKIFMWGLKNTEDRYVMYLSLAGFKRLKPIVKKTKIKVKLLERHGLPFFLHKYRKRKLFFAGIFIFACLIYSLSLFIWDIEVFGNYSRTTDVILSFLQKEKIYHGMLKSKVNCEKIEEKIRTEYGDIIWASAEMKGTRLLINVQENTDTSNKQQEPEPSDLVATRDCLITKIITRRGVPCVQVGDVVKTGDTLVSGSASIYNDNGEVFDYQYCAADADIYAKTVYDYKAEFPLDYVEKKLTGKYLKNYYLLLFRSKFFYVKRKIDFQEWKRVTNEKQVKLGNNFYLPLVIGCEKNEEYVSVKRKYTEEEARQKANQNLEEYCAKLKEKGVQIIKINVKINVSNATCISRGFLEVVEKTGKRVATETKTIEERTLTDELDGSTH